MYVWLVCDIDEADAVLPRHIAPRHGSLPSSQFEQSRSAQSLIRCWLEDEVETKLFIVKWTPILGKYLSSVCAIAASRSSHYSPVIAAKTHTILEKTRIPCL